MSFIKKQTLYIIFVITLILFTGLGLISATGNTYNSSINHTNQQVQASNNNVNLTDINKSGENLNKSSKTSTVNNRISEDYNQDDEVYTTNGGIRNISFNNGYNGYCINMSLHSASANQRFSLANTSVIYNKQHNVYVGEYLKILFYNYWDTVNSDKSSTSNAIWRFTDEIFIPYTSSDYDGPIVSSLVKNVINDYNSGFRVADHGAVKKLNNTTEMVFDFQTFLSPDETIQSYFGYKVSLRDIIDNSTTNNTNNNNNTNSNISNNTNNTNNNNNNSNISNTDDIHNSISNDTNSTQNSKILNNVINSNNKNSSDNGTGLGNMYTTGNPLFFIVAALVILGLIPFNRK